MKEFTIAVIHGKTPPSFGGDSEGASEHLMETLDKERPKIYPQASAEEDNTKMKSRKEKERKAANSLIVVVEQPPFPCRPAGV